MLTFGIKYGPRHTAPAAITTLGYGAQAAENAPPIIADDADVTVIAGHLTRFVLDLLTRAETAFPQSAYAIGLACAWIFAGPFDTWPIVLAPEGDWGPVTDANHAAALGAFVAEFFPAAKEGE